MRSPVHDFDALQDPQPPAQHAEPSGSNFSRSVRSKWWMIASTVEVDKPVRRQISLRLRAPSRMAVVTASIGGMSSVLAAVAFLRNIT